jgi:protein TonB
MSAIRLPFNRENLSRVISLAVVALVHIFLLCFLIFDIEVPRIIPDPPATVIKLSDIQEYAPPPPPPPPSVVQPVRNTVETVTEEVIEVEELEPEVEVSAPLVTGDSTAIGTGHNTGPDYLPQNQVSVLPQFDRKELQNRTVYPPIARRSGIEGTVILELFIDREGTIRNIVPLKVTPEGRGFTEAALKAFQGMQAIPAQANGENVAVRFRYPVRFTLR